MVIDNKYDFSALPVSKKTGKPVLHFVHANGMPSKVYQPIFDVLSQYFTVEYIATFAATDGYQVDENWQNLTQQVIDNVKRVCQEHQVDSVVALGHSLGALCTLQATYKQPDLFKQAVLLDPSLIYGFASFVWHVAKQLDKLPMMNHWFLDKLSPSGTSKYRKDIWSSREEAFDSFKRKAFFATFDERCLKGYVDHGLTKIQDGKEEKYILTIPKQNEVEVFRTNPSWYWLKPNHPPKVPVTLIMGETSRFVEQKFPQKVQSRLKIPFIIHQGGHMFPLEHPESVADTVLSVYQKNLL